MWKVITNARWDAAPVAPVIVSQINLWTGRPYEEELGKVHTVPLSTTRQGNCKCSITGRGVLITFDIFFVNLTGFRIT